MSLMEKSGSTGGKVDKPGSVLPARTSVKAHLPLLLFKTGTVRLLRKCTHRRHVQSMFPQCPVHRSSEYEHLLLLSQPYALHVRLL